MNRTVLLLTSVFSVCFLSLMQATFADFTERIEMKPVEASPVQVVPALSIAKK